MKDRLPGIGQDLAEIIEPDDKNRIVILEDGTVKGQVGDHDYQPPTRIEVGTVIIHDKYGELRDMAPNPNVPNSIVRFDYRKGAVQGENGDIIRREMPMVRPVTVIFQQRSK